VLRVDAVGLGALSAAAGAGSVLGAMALVVWRILAHTGLLFWTGSCLMSLCLVGFALTGNFTIALAAFALSGVGQAAFSSLRDDRARQFHRCPAWSRTRRADTGHWLNAGWFPGRGRGER
jgi:hypothetical protein